jgi:hypothetical protein
VFAFLKHPAPPVVSLIMRGWFPDCGRGLPLVVVAAAALSLAGCMPYGETVVYRLYQTNADRCTQNETDACVAVLQSSCDAPARVCTDYVPEFQTQASKQLSQKCQTDDEASCRALDAVACDKGDSAVCGRLGEDYAKLYASCKAGDANDCDSLSLSVWPKTQLDLADNACKSGDTIACRVANSSASSMKVNVNKNAQFAMF